MIVLLEPKYTSTPLLVWHIGWRLCVWGLGAGALLGGVYGVLLPLVVWLVEAVTSKDNGSDQFFFALLALALACFIGLVAGVILGGAAGGLLGLVDGVAIALITRVFFVPLTGVR